MSVHQKLGIILENKVVLNEFFFEKIRLILTLKIDFESTILALFDEPSIIDGISYFFP